MRRVDLQRLGALAMALAAVGCATKGGPLPGDDAPTLATLNKREVQVTKDGGVRATEDDAIAAYRKFLDASPNQPNAPQRAEALRRLGDLEMDRTDRQQEAGAKVDYRAAIARYEALLKAYPDDRRNDRVVYQLARAHEQNGALEKALPLLDRLVAEYPNTLYRDEANFRRGEILFSMRQYPKAEAAYAAVLQSSELSVFHERAQYMQGWSLFKQGRLEEALDSFFAVLDKKVGGLGDAPLESQKLLTRADRELVDDTFRVSSLSLSQLQGAASIPPYVKTPIRRSYEFRIYQQLAELYLKQERTKDAADTLGTFARLHPLNAQAPQLQARVVDIYAGAGFASQALQAKKDYVTRYGRDSEFRKANAEGWAKAQPLVRTHLAELARDAHSKAQKSKASADYQEAVKWYRALLVGFPDDAQAAQNTFLLAELLTEDKRSAEAAVEYELAAYKFPLHARSADAGYAALLAYAAQEKAGNTGAELQRKSVESALRFADAFPKDARTGPVLANTADRLFALNDFSHAAGVAEKVLALDPPAGAPQRRVAWAVLAHGAFERENYPEAERAYVQAVALVPANDPARKDMVERLAASVYKQGETARAKGRNVEAVGHFARVATVAPESSIRANAQYDAAAALIGMKDWDGAARTLEDFRRSNPNHPLAAEVPGKLAVAYTEKQQWGPAAAEYERIAAAAKNADTARGAQWQAAELYAKAGSRAASAKAFERYVQQYPQPLEPAVEARWKLAQMAREDGQGARALSWAKEVFQADQSAGSARTGRTRTLAALAALELATPAYDEYRKVQLVEPLARQLKLKKSKFEDALKAYAAASEYGVADVTTAATFKTAALYQDFGKSMLNSQRPGKLKNAELEQYNVLLEEQAFPFEEKATELHQINARRAAVGLYDEWVQGSFKALAELRPARYGKAERSEGALELAALEKAADAQPQDARTRNQLGIAYRQAGRFKEARAAYEKAISLQPAYATPVLNLGILHDLYLQDPVQALIEYERFQALLPARDAAVNKWIAEVKSRKPEQQATAPKPQ